MDKADKMWEDAEIGIPKVGDTVILRNHEDPGAGITHSYEIYRQGDPVYITRPYPTVFRVLQRKDTTNE